MEMALRGLRGLASVLTVIVLCGAPPSVPAAQDVPVRRTPPPAPPETEEEREVRGMLLEYLQGDAEKAITFFAARGTHQWPIIGDTRIAPPVVTPASVLFTTEVGMRLRTFGKYAMSAPLQSAKGVVGLNGMFEVNSFGAYRNVHALLGLATRPRSADDRERVTRFAIGWHVVTVSYCARWELDCADVLLASAEVRFPSTADVLVLRAAQREGQGQAAEAISILRRAVGVDPSSIAARLRLGRLLAAHGRAADARAELDRVLTGARGAADDAARYFALVALGDLDQRAGRFASARERRAAAAAITPFDHAWFAELQPAAIYRAGLFYEQPYRLAALRALARAADPVARSLP
jgi:hypothetical protein